VLYLVVSATSSLFVVSLFIAYYTRCTVLLVAYNSLSVLMSWKETTYLQNVHKNLLLFIFWFSRCNFSILHPITGLLLFVVF